TYAIPFSYLVTITSVLLGIAAPSSLRIGAAERDPRREKIISPVPPPRIALDTRPSTPTISESAESRTRSRASRTFTRNQDTADAPASPLTVAKPSATQARIPVCRSSRYPVPPNQVRKAISVAKLNFDSGAPLTCAPPPT